MASEQKWKSERIAAKGRKGKVNKTWIKSKLVSSSTSSSTICEQCVSSSALCIFFLTQPLLARSPSIKSISLKKWEAMITVIIVLPFIQSARSQCDRESVSLIIESERASAAYMFACIRRPKHMFSKHRHCHLYKVEKKEGKNNNEEKTLFSIESVRKW